MKKLLVAVVILAIPAAAYRVLSPKSSGWAELSSPGTFGFGIGELVPDLRFEDIDGRVGSSGDWRGNAATVIVIRDTTCPVSKKYGPRLGELEERYGPRGVGFLYLNVSSHDDEEAIREEVSAFGFRGRYVWDPGAELGRALRLRATTEVLVLDPTLTLVYRGAVDDQYGLDFTRPEPTRHHLVDALEQALAGEPVRVATTEVPGCLLGFDEEALAPVRAPTYHNRVSRIFARNCVTCHRDGGVAPFPLDDYRSAYGRRAMIRFMVEEGRMPPWFASPDHGRWANERRLPDRDRRDLLAWIEVGAPEGDPREATSFHPRFPGWDIGEPDAIVELPEAVEVPATGVVDYMYAYVKTDFGEDRWIRRMELRPTAPQVVHHVLVFLEAPGVARARAAGDRSARPQGGLGGYFAAMAPGTGANEFPEGSAKLLPAGAWLKFQLHYTPNGVGAVDRTRLGFVFADGPPDHPVRTAAAFDTRFEIPPGAANHPVVGEYRFREPATLLTLFPHMHVRGKAFRYELIQPDGSSRIVLDVPRYDFNWQLFYQFADPLEVPQGATLRATGWFDNSADNPANPDPGATVRFGEQTFEEMMIGYFDWIRTPADRVVEGG